MVNCIENLARLAIAEQEFERAVRLIGQVDLLRADLGLPISPGFRTDWEQSIEVTRAHLSPSAWECAWAAGRTLSLEEAVAEGLAPAAVTCEPAHLAAGGAAPTRLSPRELDVLRLIAAGQSNQQIAATLFISQHTVANHVASILNKLGVDSRAAAAAWAARSGVV
jgi:DNA-binding CsgD family transcriptional regulator